MNRTPWDFFLDKAETMLKRLLFIVLACCLVSLAGGCKGCNSDDKKSNDGTNSKGNKDLQQGPMPK